MPRELSSAVSRLPYQGISLAPANPGSSTGGVEGGRVAWCWSGRGSCSQCSGHAPRCLLQRIHQTRPVPFPMASCAAHPLHLWINFSKLFSTKKMAKHCDLRLPVPNEATWRRLISDGHNCHRHQI